MRHFPQPQPPIAAEYPSPILGAESQIRITLQHAPSGVGVILVNGVNKSLDGFSAELRPHQRNH